jgi:hypothetical protein
MPALEKIAADHPDPQGAYFDNREGLAGLPRKQHEGRATTRFVTHTAPPSLREYRLKEAMSA